MSDYNFPLCQIIKQNLIQRTTAGILLMNKENKFKNFLPLYKNNNSQEFLPRNILKKDTAIHGMQILMRNEICDFRVNFKEFIQNKDPEMLHQLRVSLRRLRCAMGFLKKISPRHELDELMQIAKNIGSALGPVRELDVLREFITSKVLSEPNNYDTFESLLNYLDRLREEEFLKTLPKLNNVVEGTFCNNITKYLSRNDYQNIFSDNKNLSILEFSKNILEKLHKKSLSTKRDLNILTDKEKHELRILLKKLRYASEFFGDFFGHKKAKKFITIICKLQDLLGSKNDSLATKRLLSKIESFSGVNISESSRIVQDYSDRVCLNLESELLSTWKCFKKAQLYWN
jgi:CHAD domain-containing protein